MVQTTARGNKEIIKINGNTEMEQIAEAEAAFMFMDYVQACFPLLRPTT